MGLSFSPVHSQSYWMEHGTLEQWTRVGNRWKLSASEAGTASLVLLPEHFINPTTGCTFRIRWHQGFSGSNANFTRVHWLLDSVDWATAPTGSVPANGWSELDEYGPLSFMHLGETGTNDSILWYGLGANGFWDSVVSPINNAHFPGSFDVELNWSQHAGSDSAHITIARIFEDESRPIQEFGATAEHGLPVGIGFSVQFTASNADAASIEILEYGPFVADTLAPVLKRARLRAGGGMQLAFSEPMNPEAGHLIVSSTLDSLPITWFDPPAHRGVALPALFPHYLGLRIRLTGFKDFNGESMADTTLTVYPVKSFAERGDVLITECMIESPVQGEWIEILNASDLAIDLHDLSVWDGSTEALKSLAPRMGWDGVLTPGQRAVLANQWGPWMVEKEISFFAEIQPSMTLSNTGETVGIQSLEGNTIDEFTYNNGWWHSSETVGLQKKHPIGCTLEQNWIALGNESESSPGIISPMEWPKDTIIQLVTESAVALGQGTGMFTLNQPLHPSCKAVVKGGWSWRDEHQPNALFWRIDSLAENSTWQITAAGVQGCFNSTSSTIKATLDVGIFPENGGLIITEIAHDPKGISEAWGTFVELLNPSKIQTVELSGCTINGIPLNAMPSLPPLGRVCIPIQLDKEHGRVELQNHRGKIIDAAAYSRCWHPKRSQSEAGLSLVRLQPQAGRVHPGAWWAWTSSAETATGCSPGVADLAESSLPSPPKATAIACGQRNGERLILFTAPVELAPPWTPIDSLHKKGLMWISPTGSAAPFEAVCPASSTNIDATLVSLNEVGKRRAGGAEPFIELANPSAHWTSTKNLFWSTAAIPFPDDWMPVSSDTEWFIPPQTTLAFASCPSRIESDDKRVLPAHLPSLWGSVELRLAESGNVTDSFIFQSEMEAPWHSDMHSIEKTNRNARGEEAQWKTAASATGNTAGSWNSWQIQPGLSLNADVLHITNSTGFASTYGTVVPISFQVSAPDEGAWQVHWTIENNLGVNVASNANLPRLIEGNQATVFHWDGGHGENFAALGPYLLKVELHSLQSHRFICAQAPVFVCPHQ